MRAAAEELRRMQEAEADSLAAPSWTVCPNVVEENPFEEDANGEGLYDHTRYDEFFE